MNMKFKSKAEIDKILNTALSKIDKQNDLEHEYRMISFRFLSEVEKLSDEKNWNKKELAKNIGTSASYITQLFRGTKLINLPTLAKFQKLFDMTFEIKAVSNKSMDIYSNIDIEQLVEPQSQPEGFWVFHKFSPTYSNTEPVGEITDLLIDRRSA
ncbi:MAG TPA: helix-turn-helix transcriptional regulator [Bacteroidales bacterium]|nr:helix-turn-helix transcriptional regulator [Bacteroidales bacterium]